MMCVDIYMCVRERVPACLHHYHRRHQVQQLKGRPGAELVINHTRGTLQKGMTKPTSLAGMLRSSINTTARLPMGGPYTPFLRLSRRESICVSNVCS